jgi:hypothetical protein
MTTISHNLIGKIDEKTVAILSEIDTIARDLKLAFFIVGATIISACPLSFPMRLILEKPPKLK